MYFQDRQKLRQYSPTKLHNAYQAVLDRGMSVHRASVMYSVPLTTLRDRVDGRIHIDTVKSGPAPLFSQEEEAKLVEHVKKMAAYGYGYSRAETIMMASDYAVYLQKRPKDKPLTNQWYYNFMSRWSEDIKLVKPRALESCRAKSATKVKVDDYFKELKAVIDKYNLASKPHCIFNVDEKGFTTDHKPTDVVGDKNSRLQYVTTGRSDTVTVIAGGNALGSYIPPFYVFPGKRMREELLLNGMPGADVSDSGWSNTQVFTRYMQEHFTKYIPTCTADSPVLVIYDGHASHVSIELLEWARGNYIIIQLLPAHCSHFLQPLDVACFGPMDRLYNKECQNYMRSHIGQIITRNEVCCLSSKAYLQSLSPSNLISAFKRTGIHPFNPQAFDPAVLKPSEALQNLTTQPESDSLMIATPVSNNLSQDVQLENQLDPFFQSRLSKAPETTSKPRNTLSKVISGKAVTEDENFQKVIKFKEQQKPNRNLIKKSNVIKRKSQQAQKEHDHESLKKAKVGQIYSQKPSTSGLVSGAKGPLVVEDSYEMTDSDDDSDDIPCCICNQRYPPSLRHCISLTIVNWAQCDECGHWTHLRFCSPVNVVRTKTRFVCPHCDK